MSATLARRITTAVVTASLAAAMVASPASALRLVPPDTLQQVSVVDEPSENPALLLSAGRLAAHMADTSEEAGSDSAGEQASLFMSSGRLLG
jgi:hypothetical protein